MNVAIKLTNLQPNTPYTLSVIAVNSNFLQSPGSTIRFHTQRRQDEQLPLGHHGYAKTDALLKFPAVAVARQKLRNVYREAIAIRSALQDGTFRSGNYHLKYIKSPGDVTRIRNFGEHVQDIQVELRSTLADQENLLLEHAQAEQVVRDELVATKVKRKTEDSCRAQVKAESRTVEEQKHQLESQKIKLQKSNTLLENDLKKHSKEKTFYMNELKSLELKIAAIRNDAKDAKVDVNPTKTFEQELDTMRSETSKLEEENAVLYKSFNIFRALKASSLKALERQETDDDDGTNDNQLAALATDKNVAKETRTALADFIQQEKTTEQEWEKSQRILKGRFEQVQAKYEQEKSRLDEAVKEYEAAAQSLNDNSMSSEPSNPAAFAGHSSSSQAPMSHTANQQPQSLDVHVSNHSVPSTEQQSPSNLIPSYLLDDDGAEESFSNTLSEQPLPSTVLPPPATAKASESEPLQATWTEGSNGSATLLDGVPGSYTKKQQAAQTSLNQPIHQYTSINTAPGAMVPPISQPDTQSAPLNSTKPNNKGNLFSNMFSFRRNSNNQGSPADSSFTSNDNPFALQSQRASSATSIDSLQMSLGESFTANSMLNMWNGGGSNALEPTRSHVSELNLEPTKSNTWYDNGGQGLLGTSQPNGFNSQTSGLSWTGQYSSIVGGATPNEQSLQDTWDQIPNNTIQHPVSAPLFADTTPLIVLDQSLGSTDKAGGESSQESVAMSQTLPVKHGRLSKKGLAEFFTSGPSEHTISSNDASHSQVGVPTERNNLSNMFAEPAAAQSAKESILQKGMRSLRKQNHPGSSSSHDKGKYKDDTSSPQVGPGPTAGAKTSGNGNGRTPPSSSSSKGSMFARKRLSRFGGGSGGSGSGGGSTSPSA